LVIKSLVWGLAIVLVFIPSVASAAAGVGVGTGKIMLDETLAGGNTYNLPAMTVYNTGDEASDYEMEVTFNERQPELKPGANWVNFSPKKFGLSPGAAQTVNMTIAVPKGAKTGDYYAYLEAHSIAPKATGQAVAHISAAAAAKFYFSAENYTSVVQHPKPPHGMPYQVNHHPPLPHGKIARHPKGIFSSALSRFAAYIGPITKLHGMNGYASR
jgi:hypothetical protein